MNTLDYTPSVFLSHVSALECWAVVGHKGLDARTLTNTRDVSTSVRCVTQLSESGVLDYGFVSHLSLPLDILVPERRKTFSSPAVQCHLNTNELPLDGLRHLTMGLYVTSPEVTYVHMGTLLTDAQLALVGSMLCGRYAISTNEDRGIYERKPLTSHNALEQMVNGGHRLRGTTVAREALDLFVDNCRSPRESVCVTLLCARPGRGGYDIQKPFCNHVIKLSDQASSIVGMRSIEVDLCWPDQKTVMEYDSWEIHNNARRLVHDDLRAEALRADGWRVITVRTGHLNNFGIFDRLVRGSLAPSLGIEIAPPTNEFMGNALQLRSEIMSFDPYVSSPQAREALRKNKRLRADGSI